MVRMKPDRESDDDALSSQFVPSDLWLEQFRKEYSGVMTRLVSSYVARRGAGIGQPADGNDNDRDARDAVVRALSDTLLGIERWDPSSIALEDHIKDVLKRQTPLDWERGKKHHYSIDATTPESRAPFINEVDRTLRERHGDPQAQTQARAAAAELRQLAADDPELLAYLDAMALELTRSEVLAMTGMSLKRYRNVRRRLSSLLSQLSTHVRPPRGQQGKP
jgi:hypothetical protein